jgi:hypothetical protein
MLHFGIRLFIHKSFNISNISKKFVRFDFSPEDGNVRFLRKVIYLKIKALQPRRPTSTFWEFSCQRSTQNFILVTWGISDQPVQDLHNKYKHRKIT